jgi:hypothetical protein
LDNGSRLGHSDNRLLAALPSELFELMQHDFKQISLSQGQAIYEPGEQIDEIYFPQSGMISLLVVAKDGNAIETATIGREGAVGLHSAVGLRLSFTRATVQVPGKFSVIRANSFAQSVRNHVPVRDLIARYTEVLWAEAQQIAACNAIHDGPARLCPLVVADRRPDRQQSAAADAGTNRPNAGCATNNRDASGAIVAA